VPNPLVKKLGKLERLASANREIIERVSADSLIATTGKGAKGPLGRGAAGSRE
jgi:hypothetical protein